jgi:3-oxoacyl-[acyl-carrier protein] reductase
MGKLAGKTSVVTGGCSGIGLAIAGLYAREGAKVGIIDLAGGKAQEIAGHLRSAHGVACIGVAGDVSDETQVKAAFRAIVAALGEVDILVNNAGMDNTAEVDGMSTEMWNRMLAVHLTGTFFCTREVLPAMRRRRWGRIINLSSQLAHKGAATMAHYCAAKAGIMGFTKSLAYEVAQEGITANCINPGATETPLLRSIPQDWLDRKKTEIPLGRFGRVEEIAPAALLLASDDGAYFVGATLNMNGGDYMI